MGMTAKAHLWTQLCENRSVGGGEDTAQQPKRWPFNHRKSASSKPLKHVETNLIRICIL